MAVCLLPGTEIAFESDVEWRRPFFGLFQKREASGRLARFRQINTRHVTTHYDAIEFPNGRIVLLADLCSGQRTIVLQLPAVVQTGGEDRSTRSHVTIIDAELIRTTELDHT